MLKPFPVYFCGVPIFSKNFDRFFENTRGQPDLSVQQIIVSGQFAEKALSSPYCVMVVLIPNKNELVNVINTVTLLKDRILSGSIRIMAYNLMNNEKVNLFLKKQGVHEIVSEGLPQKALNYKLIKHIQIVSARSQSIEAESAVSGEPLSLAARNANRGKAGGTESKDSLGEIYWMSGVEDPNDLFLLKTKGKAEFKFVQGTWIGEVIGPSPSVGYWHSLADSDSLEGYYRWSPRSSDADSDFFSKEGHWYFQGRKPEFQWGSSSWRLVGAQPKLFFRTTKGMISFYRLKSTQPGKLEITKNSSLAESKLAKILSSAQSEKTFAAGEKNRSAADSGQLDYIDGGSPSGSGTSANDLLLENEAGQGASLALNTNAPFRQGSFSDRNDAPREGTQDAQANEMSEAFQPDIDADWQEGESTFEELSLSGSLHLLNQRLPPVDDLHFIELDGHALLLDSAPLDYRLGDLIEVRFFMSFAQRHQNLTIEGEIVRIDLTRLSRSILRVEVAEKSYSELAAIEDAYQLRQERLTLFLEQAKGLDE